MPVAIGRGSRATTQTSVCGHWSRAASRLVLRYTPLNRWPFDVELGLARGDVSKPSNAWRAVLEAGRLPEPTPLRSADTRHGTNQHDNGTIRSSMREAPRAREWNAHDHVFPVAPQGHRAARWLFRPGKTHVFLTMGVCLRGCRFCLSPYNPVSICQRLKGEKRNGTTTLEQKPPDHKATPRTSRARRRSILKNSCTATTHRHQHQSPRSGRWAPRKLHGADASTFHRQKGRRR